MLQSDISDNFVDVTTDMKKGKLGLKKKIKVVD